MPVIDSLAAVAGAAALLPALMLLWLVVASDRRPDPPGLVATGFLLGVAAPFVTRLAVPLVEPAVHAIANPFLSVAARAFFIAALPEETAKIAAIAVLVLRLLAVHEPMDGVVYGAAIGLGFAAFENLGYLARHPLDWQSIALLRNLLTVPLHGALGAIAGAFLGRARFAQLFGRHRRIAPLLLCAWAIPVALHGGFDLAMLLLHDGLGDTSAMAAAATAGLLIWSAALGFAIALQRQLAGRQAEAHSARSPYQPSWRNHALQLAVGSLAAFAGATLAGAAIHQAWLTGIKPDLAVSAAAIALVALAAALFAATRQRLLRENSAEPA